MGLEREEQQRKPFVILCFPDTSRPFVLFGAGRELLGLLAAVESHGADQLVERIEAAATEHVPYAIEANDESLLLQALERPVGFQHDVLNTLLFALRARFG